VHKPAIPDPPEIQAGERLFLETRFARFFRDHFFDHWNEPHLAGGGDPVMAATRTTGEDLVGPFFGLSMNCRSCHLVDEHGLNANAGFRTYGDFAQRSPVPDRGDGQHVTTRNSPPLVNATLARSEGLLLHFDGEFASTEDLVDATMTGRNFGWKPGERSVAVAHIAQVLRMDDGSDELAEEFGGLSYRGLLAGTGVLLRDDQRIPVEFRINVDSASDEELVAAVARLITAYVEGLLFTQNAGGEFSASAFDRFLMKNGLPRLPRLGESDLDYSRRLLAAVEALTSPDYVDASDGRLRHHEHPFRFGPQELRGLRVFFTESDDGPEDGNGGIGNCVRCHAAPAFTDFSFHNTGVSQRDYDAVHGDGQFASLTIPDLAARNSDPAAWLPASEDFPDASGRFRSLPLPGAPGYADLGLWNVLGNPSKALLGIDRTPEDAADVIAFLQSLDEDYE